VETRNDKGWSYENEAYDARIISWLGLCFIIVLLSAGIIYAADLDKGFAEAVVEFLEQAIAKK
jgi:hypothetical protein